jgi:hypothetical protein
MLKFAKLIVTIGLAMILSVGLTACGSNLPKSAVIEQAIAMQVADIQSSLSQELKLKPPTLKDIRIGHVKIEQQSGLSIDREPGYHLSGTYDLTLRQSDHQATQTGDRFDLYLQKHTEGSGKAQRQIWRLAAQTPNGWQTQIIPK